MELRAYQAQAVKSIYSYFELKQGNPLVVMPTGTGKSVVIADFTKGAATAFPGTRILMLTHVKELIEQNFQALIRMWPEAPAGIYSAGVGRRDLHAQILYAGIQSIHKKAYLIQRCDLIIVDEAHLIPRNSETMYGRFLKEIKEINPQVKIIGFTATEFRLDSGYLHKGTPSRPALFTDVCFDYPMGDAIRDGYLTELTTISPDTKFDVSGVRKRGGEFIESELAQVFDQGEKNRSVVTEILVHSDRKSCLVFATSVEHAHNLADLIRAEGKTAEVVTGKTPKGERASIIHRFKAGEIWCLVNVNVLTTGFDAPAVDLIALVRATESAGLYIQMCGRGTRLAESKEDCLVLDFADNVTRHGPVDMPHVKQPGEPGGGDAPVKICEECAAYNYAGVRFCVECGWEFPPPEPKYKEKASQKPIMSHQVEPVTYRVDDVVYYRHQKEGKPDSLKVEYRTSIGHQREWVCLEHSGYAKNKAVQWWRSRTTELPVPNSVTEALEMVDDLPIPLEISVLPEGKYTRIVGVSF